MVTLKAVVESLLFASQKPLSLKEIAAALASAAEYFEEEPEAAFAKVNEAEIAESLRTLLQEASARTARLLGALKQQRRQSRAVQAAVASLRQLKLDQ